MTGQRWMGCGLLWLGAVLVGTFLPTPGAGAGRVSAAEVLTFAGSGFSLTVMPETTGCSVPSGTSLNTISCAASVRFAVDAPMNRLPRQWWSCWGWCQVNLVAPSGDQITLRTSSNRCHFEYGTPATCPYVVVGGTGAYAGASGSGELKVQTVASLTDTGWYVSSYQMTSGTITY